MTAGIFAPALALLVFFASGRAVLRLADPAGRLGAGCAASVAISFMLGMGVVSLQLFFYSLAAVPFGPVAVILPWAALYAAAAVYKPMRSLITPAGPGGSCSVASEEGPGWAGWPAVIIIAVQVLYVFSFATLLPLRGWDAWSIWFLKARAFYVNGGVTAAFLKDPSYAYSHPDYPLMVPLSAAWVYAAGGKVAETAAKVLYPVQFACMLAIFHYAASRASDKRLALVFTALLSLTPVVVIHSAGLPVAIGGLYLGDYVGYADLTLSICFLASGAFAYRYMNTDGVESLALAALFLAAGAWTKNEGLSFAAIGFIVLSAWTLYTRGANGVRRVITLAVILAVFILPWFIYKSHLHLSSEFSGRAGTLFSSGAPERFIVIIKYFARYFFVKPSLYNFTFYIYFITIPLAWRGFFPKRLFALNTLVFGQFAVYILVYMITPAEINWHLSTSLDRLVLHLAPLAMMTSAVNVASVLGCGPPGSPAAGVTERDSRL